jgi:hypothetical protein
MGQIHLEPLLEPGLLDGGLLAEVPNGRSGL